MPSSGERLSRTWRARCGRRASSQPGRCSTSSAAASATNRRTILPHGERAARRARRTTPGLPAWSLPADAAGRIEIGVEWPERVTREWAFGGSTGKGVRVCILDSGVEADHPPVGGLEGAIAVVKDEDGELEFVEDTEGDLCGHGTACAGIVHSLAPEASLFSVRVLGAGFKGSGSVLLGGLRWAVDQGFDVINMSLSTTKRHFAECCTSWPTAPTSGARFS